MRGPADSCDRDLVGALCGSGRRCRPGEAASLHTIVLAHGPVALLANLGALLGLALLVRSRRGQSPGPGRRGDSGRSARTRRPCVADCDCPSAPGLRRPRPLRTTYFSTTRLADGSPLLACARLRSSRECQGRRGRRRAGTWAAGRAAAARDGLASPGSNASDRTRAIPDAARSRGRDVTLRVECRAEREGLESEGHLFLSKVQVGPVHVSTKGPLSGGGWWLEIRVRDRYAVGAPTGRGSLDRVEATQ